MDLTGTELANYGAIGIILIILIKYLFSLMKTHREERDEYRKTIDQQYKQLVDLIKETHDRYNASNEKTISAIERNTTVVARLQGTMEAIQKATNA